MSMSSHLRKTRLLKGKESEWDIRDRLWREHQPTIERCLFCDWKFEGTALEGHDASLDHRREKHPETMVTKKRRRKPPPKPAGFTKEDEAVNAALETNRRVVTADRRPQGRPVLTTDERIRELHALHVAGVSVSELGRRHYRELGYKTPESATAAFSAQFRRRGLGIRRSGAAPLGG